MEYYVLKIEMIVVTVKSLLTKEFGFNSNDTSNLRKCAPMLGDAFLVVTDAGAL